MAQEKGNAEMVKLIGVIITLAVIGAGIVSELTKTSQIAGEACLKSGQTEQRVSKLENDMEFFKGNVSAKLESIVDEQQKQYNKQDKDNRELNQKVDKIIEYMMDIDFEETKDAK